MALNDKRQFARFAAVNVVGLLADYALAVALRLGLGASPGLATVCGFLLGSLVNYCGHASFSYAAAGRQAITVGGYLKYLLAVGLSLVVRLVVVYALGAVTALPFWLVLLCAIAASFVASYVLATLWVFRRSG